MRSISAKLALLFVCLLATFGAAAQFNKGAVLLDANINYYTGFKNKDAPEGTKASYQFSLGTTVGFMVSARNELGIGLGFASSRNLFLSSNPDNPFEYPILYGNIRKAWSLNPGVFWRHYSRLGDRLSFANGLSFYTLFGNQQYRDFNSAAIYERSFTAIRVGYTPSLAYRITRRLGVRGNFGLVGFQFSKQEGDADWAKVFSASFSPQNLNFGIFLLLNGTE